MDTTRAFDEPQPAQIERILSRLDRLEGDNARLRQENSAMRTRLDQLTLAGQHSSPGSALVPAQPSPGAAQAQAKPDASAAEPSPQAMSRRRLMRRAATTAAGVGALGAAATLARPPSAAAANGDPLTLGTTNTASAETVLQGDAATTAMLNVTNLDTSEGYGIICSGISTGLQGEGGDIGVFGFLPGSTGIYAVVGHAEGTTTGIGVAGFAAATRNGVYGRSSNASGLGGFAGVLGDTDFGSGVAGLCSGTTGHGVFGRASGTSAYGVYGQADATNSFGIYGTAPAATSVGVYGTGGSSGLSGQSGAGYGLVASGGRAPARLVPSSTVTGHPTTGAHKAGELFVDKTGKLFYCTAAGTPGTWKTVQLARPQPWQSPPASRRTGQAASRPPGRRGERPTGHRLKPSPLTQETPYAGDQPLGSPEGCPRRLQPRRRTTLRRSAASTSDAGKRS
jgi:hypothetical protein